MLLLFLAAILPLIMTPGVLFYFDVTPKLIVLLLGTAIALPMLFLSHWPRARAARWLLLLLAAQAVSVGVSTLLSTRKELSLFGSNWRSLGAITQLTIILLTLVTFIYLSGNELRIRRLSMAIAAAGSLAAVYGIAQYFGWDPWLPARAYRAGQGTWAIVRTPGTMGHAGYFSGYLVFVVFVSAAVAAGGGRAARLLGGCAAALASGAIVLSGTRGAWLGLLAGAVFLIARLRPRLSRATAEITAAVLLATVVFYLSPAGSRLRSRVHWIGEDMRGGARLLLWRDSLRLAARFWPAGLGPDAFSAEFPRFQSAGLARQYPDFYYESPHNLFLDALAAQGVPGLLVLLGWIGLGVWAGWRRAGESPYLTAALVAGVVAHCFTVFIVPTAVYFYLVIAMLVALRCEPIPHRRLWAAVPVSIAMILLALRMLAADRSLELARRAIASGRITDAISYYHKARSGGLSADVWYARQVALVAPQEALEAGTRAGGGEDAQNAYYTIAWLYARSGDVPHTEQALRATIACAPNWFKPHWMLAEILKHEGRLPEARAEASLAAWLDAGKNQEVARTLQTMVSAIPGN